MYQNAVYICISWYSKICWFSVKKCWCQQNSQSVSHDSYIFRIFFRQGITVASFIIVGNVWQILGRGAFLAPSICEQSRKSPSWIGLKYVEKICCSLISSNYLLLLDTDILLHLHFHKQCICLKPIWTSWLMHRLLMLNRTT